MRFGDPLTPQGMLMELARHHGIAPEVEHALSETDYRAIDLGGMSLADLLTKARTMQNRSLPQVQRKSGLSISQLKYYENGFQKNPGVRTLHCLAFGYSLPFVTVLLATIRDTMPKQLTQVRRRTRATSPDDS